MPKGRKRAEEEGGLRKQKERVEDEGSNLRRGFGCRRRAESGLRKQKESGNPKL